jgi:hypothetical protein
VRAALAPPSFLLILLLIIRRLLVLSPCSCPKPDSRDERENEEGRELLCTMTDIYIEIYAFW